MWGIKQIIVTNETSNLIHEYSQMHIFMFVSWHYCSVSVSPPHRAPASSSWTPGTRPPRRWPSCWWPPAQTDALPLSFWPISETNVSNSVWEARSALCNHLSLCLLWPPLLLSASLFTLLSLFSGVTLRLRPWREPAEPERGCGLWWQF